MLSRSAPMRVPVWWPKRVYYGWALIVALGLTVTASYGILSYAFAAFIEPMGRELGWSKTQITGGFSLAQLVAGITAIPVGRLVDRHGARVLMTVGSALAALLLVAWSTVQSLYSYYGVWILMGAAMGAVLYEPAFAVVATWFETRRDGALTALTFIAGFAAVIFVPLASVLIAADGWRRALVILAVVYAVLTVIPHAFVLRRRPADLGLRPDGASVARKSVRDVSAAELTHDAAHVVIKTAAFRRIAIAFALSALTMTAVSVHLVPLLVERGYDVRYAGSAMGILGLMALPGRLIFAPLGRRWGRGTVTASIFALQAIALLCLLLLRNTFGVWGFVVLFGAGFGAITPARAALIGDIAAASNYGRVSGTLAFILSLARAAAPIGASVLYTRAGGREYGYDAVLVALSALCVCSAVATLDTEKWRGDVDGRVYAFPKR